MIATAELLHLLSHPRGCIHDRFQTFVILRHLPFANLLLWTTYANYCKRALLTFDNAKSHLLHFCQVLPTDSYVDHQPEFTISRTVSRISAEVILPTAVPSHLRRSSSRSTWQTERTAKKDACFEAMLALHQAGLINDNLLPRPPQVPDALEEKITEVAAIEEVAPLLNPWIDVAQYFTDARSFNCSVLTFWVGEEQHIKMRMLLPAQPPVPADFALFWNSSIKWRVTCEPGPSVASSDLGNASESTELLLGSVFSFRLKPHEQDYVAHFMFDTDLEANSQWTVPSKGCRSASDVYQSELDTPSNHGLVHPVNHLRPAYIFKGWSMRVPKPKDDTPEALQEVEAQGEQLHIDVLRWPKRVDLLHPIPEQEQLPKTYSGIKHLLAEEYVIENLPLKYSQFALCIPSILRRYEVCLIAERLCKTVFAAVQFQDLNLVLAAIGASSAREESNYQRLEFLGDSILKMCTSVQLMGEHANWHEGYLSAMKDRIVANSRLARAAVDCGLDAFIITQPFTGRKWCPLYVSDLLNADEAPPPKREMSTKVLADVVEALIGVAFLDGGFSKALKCMSILLPDAMLWQELSIRLDGLYDLVPVTTASHLPNLDELEHLISYTFTRKSLLLEALTHPSYNVDTTVVSYQRLEFLGDSLLDQIVASLLFDARPEIAHFDMHLMRTVLVNADFLAFLCMEHFTTQSRVDIHRVSDPSFSSSTTTLEPKQSSTRLYLWQFMRHATSAIHQAQKDCMNRHAQLREGILEALTTGMRYPWTSLTQLQAEKFFSDIVESVLGAIYVDTKGDRGACERFLEKLGVLSYLRRIVGASSKKKNEEKKNEKNGMGEMRLLHPRQELGIKAGTKKVTYILSAENTKNEKLEDGDAIISHGTNTQEENHTVEGVDEDEMDDINIDWDDDEMDDERSDFDEERLELHEGVKKRRAWECLVKIGDEDIVSVGNGMSKEEVMTRAAEEAVRVLSARERERARSSHDGGTGGSGDRIGIE